MPRSVVTVEVLPAGPLGVPQGTVRVRTLRSSQDKKPWNELPTREGTVEVQFVRPVHLGSTLLPFRCLAPIHAVLPELNGDILEVGDPALDAHPAMAKWWSEADRIWSLKASSRTLSLSGRVDYQRTLRCQFPTARHRVVYNRSGTRLTAAYVPERDAVIDTKLYWSAVSGRAEADYLCAILNSRKMTELVNPVQSQGHFGPRDFYSLPFEFPIPLYAPQDDLHVALSDLGRRSADLAASTNIPDAGFQGARKRINTALDNHELTSEADQMVSELLLIV